MTQSPDHPPLPTAAWWHPHSLERRLPALHARARVLTAIRAFFLARDFLEVETPGLQVSPGMEPHLMAFGTQVIPPDGGAPRPRYLHTSPEFAMKKLLAGGLPRIFQIARVWRNGERSATHHPEFSMLEWYRAGATYRDLMDDVEALFAAVGEARPLRRLTVAEAFARYAGMDLLATVPDPFAAEPPPEPLGGLARGLGLNVPPGARWEDAFFHIFLARIEPGMEADGPTILHDWPACMAALSRRSAADPRVCERFEVYVDGLELANAFGELTDPVEQRRRFAHDMDVKERLYGVRYPIDDGFLEAVGRLPDCAGIALGVDRLVMVLTGAKDIADVLWAPVE